MIFKRLKERVNGQKVPMVPEAPKPIIEVTGTSGILELEAEVIYICGTLTSLSFTLSSYDLIDCLGAYHLFFTSGNTPTTVEYPQTIKFPKGVQPTIESNKTYEFHIINNCLTYEWYE